MITTTVLYDDNQQQVIWHGINLEKGASFDSFMANEVASRLHDKEGAEEFESHLRGLASTEFERDSLRKILEAEIPEEREWAIGEALAEAYLSQHHNVIWPWNMKRDKRSPKASLPGADLIGFQINNGKVRFVLGEVKTSSDKKTPPGVMNGRSGMKHQIDKLASDPGLLNGLLRWLLFRCRNTVNESSFNEAIGCLLNSGNKALSLYGVLIRDTTPNQLDLRSRGKALSKILQDPTTCHLIAIYLPCTVKELPDYINGCES
ncbi:hypothetical protein [Methanoplanus limicola]|uniref:Anti-bacteriophage protein A/HamA C-terminal domain-containing protein n=1 Tax=Methanoplanus limicola DSM 2279 TaxID=937775 RepID=H1Z1M9_9EURY|nr:hypothetical protein [Methanoplanus limicola]EHQ34555.1 hypothetical protein Metlim_0416 [Methanoplanus limicola DSM 2279]